MRYDMAERLAELAVSVIYGGMLRKIHPPADDAKTECNKSQAFAAVKSAFLYYGRRRVIPKKVRLRVFRRDGNVCRYCKLKFPTGNLHVDHIIPVVEGGYECMENFATACSTCNFKKGAKKLPAEDGTVKQ